MIGTVFQNPELNISIASKKLKYSPWRAHYRIYKLCLEYHAAKMADPCKPLALGKEDLSRISGFLSSAESNLITHKTIRLE